MLPAAPAEDVEVRALRRRERRALTSASFYGAAMAVDGALKLLLLPLVTRAVSPSVFGRFALLSVVSPILTLLVDFGAGTGAIRELAKQPPVDNPREVVSTLVSSRAPLSALLVLTISLGAALGRDHLSEDMRGVLPLFALAVAFQGLYVATVDAHRGLGNHRAVIAGNLLRSFVSAGATVQLVVLGHKGLHGLVLALTFSQAAALLVGAAFLRRHALATPSLAVFRRLVGFGAPVAAYGALRCAGALDRYFIKFVSSIEQAGFYQVATVPTAAVEMMEAGGLQSIEPYLFGLSVRQRDREFPRILRSTAALFLSVAVALSVIGPEILSVLAPADYAEALNAIPPLLFAAVLRVQTRVAGYGAGMVGGTRVWAIGAAADLLVAAMSIAVLAPRWFAAGAAWGHVVGASVGCVVVFRLVHRTCGLPLPLKSILGALLLSAITCALVGTRMLGAPASLVVRLGVGAALVAAAVFFLMRPSLRRSPGT